MSKGVEKIRASIRKRKTLRKRLNHPSANTFPIPVSYEERHGFHDPMMLELPTNSKNRKLDALLKSVFIKIIISIFLFMSIGIVLQTNIASLSKWKIWTHHALVDEFPFATVHAWYVSTFGSPVALFPNNSNIHDVEPVLPVSGQIVEPFSATGTGIFIAPTKRTPVTAFDHGIVVFAGNDRLTNKTVQIQHADGSYSTYGHLTSIDVHLYEKVGAQETIGLFEPNQLNDTFYFSLQKDRTYIDPAQVISVDDFP